MSDDSNFCCYCGVEFNQLNRRKQKTKDHLIPVSKGGVNSTYNKKNCCGHCNTRKSNKIPHDWLIELETEYKFATTSFDLYELPIIIENVKYIIEYVNSAGEKLFTNKDNYKWFRRRYLKQKVSYE